MTTAENIPAQSPVYFMEFIMEYSPTATGRTLSEFPNIREMKYSFHILMKLNMVTVTIPGWAMGKHNQPEGLNRGAAVNGSCFLKRPGQIGKKGGQENGGVGHIDSDIQEYQSGPVGRNIIKDIETCHHGKQRKHNHDYRNTHGRHKR